MSIESKKLDILLEFSKEYNLKETEDPATYEMDCGKGYTLRASSNKPWIIRFNDGLEITDYPVDSTKVPFTSSKDAINFQKKFNAKVLDLADEIGEEERKEAWDKVKESLENVENNVIYQVENDSEEKARIEREENEARLEAALAEKEKQEPVKKYEAPKKEFQKTSVPSTKPTNTGNTTLLKIVENYIKNDLVQIFGDTGTGKTSISMQIANDARNEGRRVLYVDSEHNTTDDQASAVKANGIDYVYIPDFEEMYQYIRKIPSYDVVIVDSMGLPVLNLYATMGMRERGDALLKMIALTAFLKKYANQNKALIVVTNQPESDFNKDPNTARRPFGDKSQFNTKEIFRTVFAKGGRLENKTTIILKAYRSRSCGMDSRICSVEISDNGVKVIQ